MKSVLPIKTILKQLNILWECGHIKYFWDSFKTLLHNNCEMNNIVFDAESIVFGSPNLILITYQMN